MAIQQRSFVVEGSPCKVKMNQVHTGAGKATAPAICIRKQFSQVY